MHEYVLQMTDIKKSFGGVHALKGVEFSCIKGEVHCLAGENGAGKSTLLKILAGVFSQDSGSIKINGQETCFKSPQDAKNKGIAMVFQELTLISQMSVAENILLNIEPKNKLGIVQKKQMLKITQELMQSYNIDINPDALASSLTVAQQQLVEILKILARDPEIIILDEPTSALARPEVEKLTQIIKTMTQKGKTIIFISHRMEEVFSISNRITVFKDGEYVGTKQTSQIDESELVKMMIGRSLQNVFPPHGEIDNEKIVLKAVDIAVSRSVHKVSIEVKKGEILGIAGLQGHGQTELLHAIAGVVSHTGDVFLNDVKVNCSTVKNAIKQGIALVPADRKTQGLFLSLSVSQNLALASMFKRQKLGFVLQKMEKDFVKKSIQSLSIKLASPNIAVQSLSGGNQQKVVLGKELGINPKALLFNEPTRGIDIEAKSEFYTIMRNLANQGVAIIVFSSDLMEVVGNSDRVIVMYEGKITGELSKEEISEENIMRCAVGI